jgi:hypothetical protein
MHGKRFLLDSVHAGIDEENVYGRLDFAEKLPHADLSLVINLESWAAGAQQPRLAVRIDAEVQNGAMQNWKVAAAGHQLPLASSSAEASGAKVVLGKNFEFKLPLKWLIGTDEAPAAEDIVRGALRVRFSLWQNRLPVDALPLEGWIELQLLSEADLIAAAY